MTGSFVMLPIKGFGTCKTTWLPTTFLSVKCFLLYATVSHVIEDGSITTEFNEALAQKKRSPGFVCRAASHCRKI